MAGGAENDSGQLVVSGSEVTASLTGSADQTFSAREVEQLIFIGFGGDDTFDNGTAIPSRLIGGDGNDTLSGGSGEDIINGGRGDDELRGRGSSDRIVGHTGADMIFGDAGDDLLLGGSGLNEIYGIGHNLGLEHSGANGNLMQENSDGTSLEQYQIDILRESRFTGAR